MTPPLGAAVRTSMVLHGAVGLVIALCSDALRIPPPPLPVLATTLLVATPPPVPVEPAVALDPSRTEAPAPEVSPPVPAAPVSVPPLPAPLPVRPPKLVEKPLPERVLPRTKPIPPAVQPRVPTPVATRVPVPSRLPSTALRPARTPAPGGPTPGGMAPAPEEPHPQPAAAGSNAGVGQLFARGDIGVSAHAGPEVGAGAAGQTGIGNGTSRGGSQAGQAGNGSGSGSGSGEGIARPLGGYQIKPHYPEAMKRLGAQGTTLLKVRVNIQGIVDDVLVAQSAGHSELDLAAMGAVKQWKFAPARQGQQPVAVWVMLPVRFSLR